MVNYDLFASILKKNNEGYIESGDHLDERTIELFIKYDITNIKQLFKKEGGAHFFADVKCGCCGKVITKELNKTKIINYINDVRQGRNNTLCNECYLESERRRLEKENQRRKSYENEMKDNTKEYIENYLNPDNSWEAGVKNYVKMQKLETFRVDKEEIKDYIRSMDYHDFLMTPYWKAIAEKVKRYHNLRCQLCGGTEGLSVHHATYENHGDELHNLKDLICLCKDCHEKFHDIDK